MRVLSESYLMSTNMTRLRLFFQIFALLYFGRTCSSLSIERVKPRHLVSFERLFRPDRSVDIGSVSFCQSH